MRILTLILMITISYQAVCQRLPQGISSDTNTCNYAPGLFSYYFYKSNEMVGMVMPDACNFSGVEGDGTNKYFIADFYSDYKKDTFETNNEALIWIVAAMQEYYKPVLVNNWQNISVQLPEVRLKYPEDWTYRTDQYDGVFKSMNQGENKLTLMRKVPGGQSEVCFIIRTPNSAGLTTIKLMEMAAQMNRAIDIRSSPEEVQMIGGKPFRTAQNQFMTLMDQYHFWFADEQELIYINYNLLKDERIRYPEVMKTIIESISW